MKKVIRTIGLSILFTLLTSAQALAAAGAGSVNGTTITYTITGIPENKPKTFTVYLLTNNAQIKCYKAKSNNPPDAKNYGKVNRYNMTPAMSKGTTSSRSGLSVKCSDGSSQTVAEKVTFSYDYVNGTFSGTVTIVNPSSSLTGLAFVGRDGSNHYYPIGGVDGTIDISQYVRAAQGNSGGGSSEGSGSAGGSGSGSGTTSPTQPATQPATQPETQPTTKSQEEAQRESQKAEADAKMNDIKDKINNGGGRGSTGSGIGAGKEVPPCVLGRILS